jgi:hypothetical protein
MDAKYFAGLYARYVIACIQARASPVSMDAFREFLRVALAPSRGTHG